MFGQKSLAPKMAALFDIPLVSLVKMKLNMEVISDGDNLKQIGLISLAIIILKSI